jgi:2,3-bisphosphoglycerate-independent phosphoglycerate mutase
MVHGYPKTILIVPELLSAEGGETALRQDLPTLTHMTELGELRRLTPIPEVATPEAAFLGMRTGEAEMAQGPLTVSAFGADPPDRSTHFHLSLLTFDGERIADPQVDPAQEELERILEMTNQLNTRSLTIVKGDGRDHGLVWEGLGDLSTHPAKRVEGEAIRAFLPEGDAEVALRRFIDDSINLLSESELNQRRIDEGLPPFNLLWPWGHGVRVPVPNLALRRGEPVMVESESIRMAGLSRLAGYRHGDRHGLRHGLNLDLPQLANRSLETGTLLALVSGPRRLRAKGQLEELEWFVSRLDSELLRPLFDAAAREPRMIVLLAPRASGPGLALNYVHGAAGSNTVPFDERALSELSVPVADLSTAVDEALSCQP